MSRCCLAVLAATLVLALAGCSKSAREAEANIKPEAARKKAPGFSLKDANGQMVNLSDFQGKVVLMNFWATWCGPCEVEIPWFIEFQQKYKDRDFAVVGISMDDDGWRSVKPYMALHKINYPVVIGSEVISQKYGDIEALPTSFILDRQGRVAAAHVGLVDKSDYLHEIIKLIDDPKRAAAGGSAAFRLAGLIRPALQ